MLANLHAHTFRCRHASGTDREYVEAALAAGYRAIGFSDHCPWPWDPAEMPPGYRSNVRMDAAETGGYFASLLALREEYAGRIDIRIGFEAEYLPHRVAAQDELFSRFPLDYLILGQHSFGDEWLRDWSSIPTTDESRLARYVDTCVEGLSTGRFVYLAHPDIIRYEGPESVWEKHMGRLCDFLRERDLPVEVNLLGLATGRHYPSRRMLRLAAARGNWATIGVDAHSPDRYAEAPALEARARALCEEAGLPLREPPVPAPVRTLSRAQPRT